MKVLIALGGNAILKRGEKGTAEEQMTNVRATARHLVKLLEEGDRLAITHGNGPQVGDILLKNEFAKAILPPMPLDICGAESQGMIGYMLQQGLQDELYAAGLDLPVVTVVTRVLIDQSDPAFANPTKPIGPFYTYAEVPRLQQERGWKMVDDSGRGFRRVVPSPSPVEILEGKTVAELFESGTLVIAAGGGGIPVVRDNEGVVKGVEAVLDKDRTAALLAEVLGVEILLILTDVPQVYLDYNKPGQHAIEELTVQECKRLLEQGQFPAGSMGPKIESAVRFLESGGDRVIITSLEMAENALAGRAGTRIVR
ncbi:MAG: carbamate kinase [Thaumarchaeota archaeon]|nr:carbamate kinase [Nitrososphaerota archaeon]